MEFNFWCYFTRIWPKSTRDSTKLRPPGDMSLCVIFLSSFKETQFNGRLTELMINYCFRTEYSDWYFPINCSLMSWFILVVSQVIVFWNKNLSDMTHMHCLLTWQLRDLFSFILSPINVQRTIRGTIQWWKEMWLKNVRNSSISDVFSFTLNLLNYLISGHR